MYFFFCFLFFVGGGVFVFVVVFSFIVQIQFEMLRDFTGQEQMLMKINIFRQARQEHFLTWMVSSVKAPGI